jgi:drug/metabolite transporter (DMT)-like permease
VAAAEFEEWLGLHGKDYTPIGNQYKALDKLREIVYETILLLYDGYKDRGGMVASSLPISGSFSGKQAGAESIRSAKLLLAFAAIYFIWGSTYLAIRVALEGFPPFVLMGVRSVAAGGVLYLWARGRGGAAPDWRQWRGAAICGLLMFLVGHGGLAWGQQRVASGIAALLLTSEPFWIALLGWKFAGESKPTGRAVAGLVVGVLGLGLLMGGNEFQGEASIDSLGAVVILVGAFSWAWGALYSRSASLPRSPVLSAGMQLLAGGLCLLLVALATGEIKEMGVSTISLRPVAALAYLIVFGSVLGFSAYIWLLRVVSPTTVATHTFVNPVVAVLLGWALLREPLTATTAMASAIIVAGVALVVIQPRRME